jgi:four helix bundle protein
MSATFEDLQVLKSAEEIADLIWKFVVQWDEFTKDVVGKQITCSADSIGANIAESFGRYNFGEKPQFLYYSRGSLFETKYWLNRAIARQLMKQDEVNKFVADLTSLARQLNTFAKGLKTVRSENSNKKVIRESSPEYLVENFEDLFSEEDINWLSK